jgi:hypothetical protein
MERFSERRTKKALNMEYLPPHLSGDKAKEEECYGLASRPQKFVSQPRFWGA